MVAVDTNMLAAVVIIGGIILFSVANRKDILIQVPRDEDGVVPMVTDEWTVQEYEGKPKKATFDDGQLGGQAERVQAIVKYMLQEVQLMIQAQTYFDDNFRQAGNKNIAWLKESYPKAYQNLLVTRGYCVNRELEFKDLWHELSQRGEHTWLAANSYIQRVPTDVISRLDSYYRVDQSDIEQFTMDQINHAVYDLESAALRALEGQAKNFQEWHEQSMQELERTQNNQGMDVMEDNDGHWLMQNPLEDGTIQYTQARNLVWRDLNGVQQSRTIYDQVNMPQHRMQANDNGRGWDNGDNYYQKGGGGYPDDDEKDYGNTQLYDGQPYITTNPNGQRQVPTQEGSDLFKVKKAGQLQLGENNSYNNRDSDEKESPGLFVSSFGEAYGTVNASSVRPQDMIAPNPYSKEFVAKTKAPKGSSGADDINDIKHGVLRTIESQADNPNPVNEFDAAQVTELEPTNRQASATVNINSQPQVAYVALEQPSGLDSVTSPRGKGKRGRSGSSAREPLAAELGFGTISSKAAPKKPRTVEIQVAQPTTLEVRPGVNDGNP